MKKIATKKHLSFLLLFAMLITLAVPAAKVNANESDMTMPKRDVLYYYSKSTKTPGASTSYYVPHKIVSVKSSKPSVLQVDASIGYNYIYVTTKKTGTTTLTVKTKKKTYKCKVKVIPYKSPFKKFSIGKANFKKGFSNQTYLEDTLSNCGLKSAKKQKIVIKLNKNFSSMHISLSQSKNNGKNSSYKTIKSGYKAKFKNRKSTLSVDLKDKRTGKILYFDLVLQ